MISRLLPTQECRLYSGDAESNNEHTPEFRLPAGCSVQLPTFSLRMEGQDDGIVANLLGDKFHPRIFKGFAKHGITGEQSHSDKL